MIKSNESNSKDITIVLRGALIALATSIFLLVIFSAILTYSNVNEDTIPTVIIIITAISILLGSQIAIIKIKKNGMINGALVGVIYIFSIYLLSSCITRNFALGKYSIIMIITSVIIGGLGGIIGINRKK